MQFEALNEISKVAAVKAASALSKFLAFPVGIDVELIETKKIDEISFLMPAAETVVGINVPLLGSLHGASLLVYPEEAAFAMCDALFHRKGGETQQFAEAEISALTEVANIVIGNFLTSFAMPLKIEPLMHKVADFHCSRFSKFITLITSSLSKIIKEGVVLEILFHFHQIKITGTGIFLINEEEIKSIVKML